MSLLAPAFTYQRRPMVDAQGNPLPSDDPTTEFPQDMTPTGAETPPPPPVSMPPAMGPPPSSVPPPVQAGGPQSDEQTADEIAQMRSIPPEVNVQAKPTIRDRLLGHSNATPPPVSVAANGAQQMPNAPAPRTPGVLQRIAAAGLGAATGYVNAARRTQIDPDTIARGEQGILHPGYGAQMGAYNRTVQQIQGQAGLDKDAAATAHTNAQATLSSQQAATLAAEGKRAPKGNYVPIPGGGLFNADTGEWVKQPTDKSQLTEITKEQADGIGIKPAADGHFYIPNAAVGQYIGSQKEKSVKTVEEALVALMGDDSIQPDQKKQRADELIKAHNLLHPQTPIHGIETDASGNSTLVVANPTDPTNVQKVPLGKIGKPQQPPASIQLGNMLASNPDAVTTGAVQYRQTRTMPPIGRNPMMAVAILNKAAEMDKAEGISPEQSGIAAERFKALRKALDQQTVAFNQVASFEKTASKNMDLADSVSQTVDRSGSPLVNKYLLYLKGTVAGDTDTIKLHNAVTTAASEYAKVISGGMGNTAVTDSTRKEAEAMLNAAFSKGTFSSVIVQMKQEMANRNSGFSETIKQLQSDMGGGQAPTAQQGGKIRVKRKSDGITGTIDASDFSDAKYEKVK